LPVKAVTAVGTFWMFCSIRLAVTTTSSTLAPLLASLCANASAADTAIGADISINVAVEQLKSQERVMNSTSLRRQHSGLTDNPD
jgi:hypothetical protein